MLGNAPLKRRLAAILAADVVGYSAMVQRDEVGAVQKPPRKRPDGRTSYDLHLNALGHLNCARLGEAEILLQKAIGVYPDYASAKAILAWCTTLRLAWQSSREEEALHEKGALLCDETSLNHDQRAL